MKLIYSIVDHAMDLRERINRLQNWLQKRIGRIEKNKFRKNKFRKNRFRGRRIDKMRIDKIRLEINRLDKELKKELKEISKYPSFPLEGISKPEEDYLLGKRLNKPDNKEILEWWNSYRKRREMIAMSIAIAFYSFIAISLLLDLL